MNPSNAGHASRPLHILLTGYGSGATRGRNLGTAGYSYDFVASLFEPLLAQCGDCEHIEDAEGRLAERAATLQAAGKRVVHVGFRAMQDSYVVPGVPNVIVPAWEFPDVPAEGFDGNPRNDWTAVAREVTRVIVHGEFTRASFERAGVTENVSVVPVPTPESYFDVPDLDFDRSPTERIRIDRGAVVLGGDEELQGDASNEMEPVAATGTAETIDATAVARQPTRTWDTLRPVLKAAYKWIAQPFLPRWLETGVRTGIGLALTELASDRLRQRCGAGHVDLDGVVYTSIFNPRDGRKNWEDMLSAFLLGLGDRPDATLVLKLVGRDPSLANPVLGYYRSLDIPHRCRIVLIKEFLSDEEMLDLVRASTYYVTTTRAEGNCLPLMNYLAAGRPAVSPSHTAIADYFDSSCGFVVESHSEPCAWPQDSRLRSRTTWHRPVWTSLVDQLRESYTVAKTEPDQYAALAANARDVSRRRHHPDNVLVHLRDALQRVSPEAARTPRDAEQLAPAA